MKKDTVYIDTEDDITVILGKIKASSEKLVALVPPKRVGVLQSAVNLRLLKRAAKQANKHLVLVTNDSALRSLAAVEQLPVAKTLQSKPEVPEVPTIDMDDGDDIIDGASLPISDHAKNGGQDIPDEQVDDKASVSDDVPDPKRQAVGAAAVAKTGEKDVKKAKKGQPKVPNFNKVRKRAIIIGILAVLLIGFLVWAIRFAPRATVNIQASTIEESLNLDVALKSGAEPNLDKATLPLETRELTDNVSVDINPTGTKNVGEKATGTVVIKPAMAPMIDNGSVTVPAGSVVTSASGAEFTTDSSVTISGSGGFNNGESVGVTARERGENSNGASGSASTDASGVRSVAFEDATSGGTDKEVKVVTNDDVKKARAEMDEKLEDSDKQAELTKQFGDEYIVLEDSFSAKKDDVKPSPAVGEEVSGDAKLAGEVNYVLHAVPKSDLGTLLDEYFNKAIEDEPNQRIYDNGVSEARFMTTEGSDDSWTSTLIATANVGPDIKDDQVKEVAKGKKFDEIRTALESINGVKQAHTDFWPFWVNKAPSDSNRITVIFDVDGKN